MRITSYLFRTGSHSLPADGRNTGRQGPPGGRTQQRAQPTTPCSSTRPGQADIHSQPGRGRKGFPVLSLEHHRHQVVGGRCSASEQDDHRHAEGQNPRHPATEASSRQVQGQLSGTGARGRSTCVVHYVNGPSGHAQHSVPMRTIAAGGRPSSHQHNEAGTPSSGPRPAGHPPRARCRARKQARTRR